MSIENIALHFVPPSYVPAKWMITFISIWHQKFELVLNFTKSCWRIHLLIHCLCLITTQYLKLFTKLLSSNITNSLNHSYCKCIIRKNLDLPYLAFLQGDQIGKAFNQIQNPCLSSTNGIKIYEMCSWHVKGKKLLVLNSDSW